MKRWQIVIGIILIVLGLISLLDNLFSVNLGRFIGPFLLIGLGLLVIFRHQMIGPGVEVRMSIIGDIQKSGNWEAKKHEIWWFVGTTKLDFSGASFPEGEAKIKIFGFVNDVKILLPEDVGLRIESSAFFSDYRGIERRTEDHFGFLTDQTSNYPSMEKRAIIQITSFVADIHVKPI